jgi:peptidyl-prolyl cis-trans isomerase C
VRAQVQSTEFVKNWATDALLAESARAGALHASRVVQVERGVLARGVLESIYQKARELGQPTERELQELTLERWTEFDRPAAAQTTHFVVRTTEGQPTTSAELLARRLAVAVRGCKTAEEFKTIVGAFPKENGLEVVVESLPPVTRDGRSLRMSSDDQVLGAGPSFDLKFAQVASSLTREGEQSEIVQTSFGFHVIRLDRKIPLHQASIETRREKLTDDVYLRRARQETDRCIQDSRQRHQIKIETSFQEVVAQLQATQ